MLAVAACDANTGLEQLTDIGVEQQAEVAPTFATMMAAEGAYCMPLSLAIQQCVGPRNDAGRAHLYLLHEGRVISIGRFISNFKSSGYSMKYAPAVWVQNNEAVWPVDSRIYLYRDGKVHEIRHDEGSTSFVALSSDGEIWANIGHGKDFAVIGLDGVTLRYEDGPPFSYFDVDAGEEVPLSR